MNKSVLIVNLKNLSLRVNSKTWLKSTVFKLVDSIWGRSNNTWHSWGLGGEVRNSSPNVTWKERGGLKSAKKESCLIWTFIFKLVDLIIKSFVQQLFFKKSVKIVWSGSNKCQISTHSDFLLSELFSKQFVHLVVIINVKFEAT